MARKIIGYFLLVLIPLRWIVYDYSCYIGAEHYGSYPCSFTDTLTEWDFIFLGLGFWMSGILRLLKETTKANEEALT